MVPEGLGSAMVREAESTEGHPNDATLTSRSLPASSDILSPASKNSVGDQVFKHPD